MFEDLFIDGGTIARYRCEPLLEERLSYLRHCAQEGARPNPLRTIAAAQITLIRLLDLRAGERVSVPRIEAAADRRSSRSAQPKVRRIFVSRAVRWLRFVDLLDEPFRVRQRHAHVAEAMVFREWMRKERGWSAATIRSYGYCLRTFFRFAERQDWCAPGLADGIMPVRFHPGETLPKGLKRDEVLRLLATTEGNRQADLRDRALLMVLTAYGLRASEVAGLRLDDLNWEEETLRVRRPKSGCTHHYPLSPRRRPVDRALPHRGSSSTPGEGAVPHADCSDPSGDPADSFERRQDTPRSARYHRQASRCPCASSCCRPAPARPRPVDQGGRRLPRPSQHLVHRSVRQSAAQHPP